MTDTGARPAVVVAEDDEDIAHILGKPFAPTAWPIRSSSRTARS
jgi:hypothetical protein